MKAIHIREVDGLVIERIGRLARLHKRSMQAELRQILEEASRRAEALEVRDEGGPTLVSVSSEAGYGRDEIYDDAGR